MSVRIKKPENFLPPCLDFDSMDYFHTIRDLNIEFLKSVCLKIEENVGVSLRSQCGKFSALKNSFDDTVRRMDHKMIFKKNNCSVVIDYPHTEYRFIEKTRLVNIFDE